MLVGGSAGVVGVVVSGSAGVAGMDVGGSSVIWRDVGGVVGVGVLGVSGMSFDDKMISPFLITRVARTKTLPSRSMNSALTSASESFALI